MDSFVCFVYTGNWYFKYGYFWHNNIAKKCWQVSWKTVVLAILPNFAQRGNPAGQECW